MKYVKIEGAIKLHHYIKPMLAKLSDQPAFNHPDWIFEIKWDGYRAVVEIGDEGVRFYSRNGLTFHKAYPRIYEELQKIKTKAIIDGEVVAFDQEGKPSFQALQNYNNRKKTPLLFYAFDCLSYNGEDITGLSVLERKEILKQLLPESKVIRYCDHIQENGKEFYDQIVKANLEGMIAKKSDSCYYIGRRTSAWLKIKNVQTIEAVIIGYTDPKGSRVGFGALLLAVEENGKLSFIGHVGTGFTDRMLKTLYSTLKAIEQDLPSVDIPIKITPEMHWVKPLHSCKIKYTEKTEEGIVRHPVFLGMI